MRASIEPTGIAVRNGKVQIRLSFYLERGDARYEEHHVQIPVIPPEGYLGEVDEMGTPADIEAYNEWRASLPYYWRDNPFHNHFIRIGVEATDEDIKSMVAMHLDEFYGIWSRGGDIVREWKRPPKEGPGDVSQMNIERCEIKALDIAKRAKVFEQRGMNWPR